jgi:alkylation response protein AidB-like acyl-CoA dehydrogenase
MVTCRISNLTDVLDAWIQKIYGGTNEIMKLLIARSL